MGDVGHVQFPATKTLLWELGGVGWVFSFSVVKLLAELDTVNDVAVICFDVFTEALQNSPLFIKLHVTFNIREGLLNLADRNEFIIMKIVSDVDAGCISSHAIPISHIPLNL